MTATPKPIDDGGPAFPVAYPRAAPGMSLRQHYAGLAMQGLLADPARTDTVVRICRERGDSELAAGEKTCEVISEAAVLQADALIAELNKARTDATDDSDS